MMIVTLATIPACLAVVTLLKDLGLPSRFAALTSVVVGIALAIFDLFMGGGGGAPEVLNAIATGLILGLSAAGLYDASRLVGGQEAVTQARRAMDDSGAAEQPDQV